MDGPDGLTHLLVGDAGVDVEEAAVAGEHVHGCHRIGQSLLLPDVLEQAGAHASAEDAVEQHHGVEPVVRQADGGTGQADVGLLDVLHIHPEALPVGFLLRRGQALGPGHVRQTFLELLGQPVRIEIAGHGDDHAVAGILFPVIVHHLLPADPGQALRRAQNGVADGIAAVHQLGDDLHDILVRSVLDHLDLLQDHLPLPFDLFFVEDGSGQDIDEDLRSLIDVGGQGLDVVAGGLPSREGVAHAADPVRILSDLPGRPLLRALEHHMLNKMGNAGYIVPFQG